MEKKVAISMIDADIKLMSEEDSIQYRDPNAKEKEPLFKVLKEGKIMIYSLSKIEERLKTELTNRKCTRTECTIVSSIAIIVLIIMVSLYDSLPPEFPLSFLVTLCSLVALFGISMAMYYQKDIVNVLKKKLEYVEDSTKIYRLNKIEKERREPILVL